MGLTTDEMTGYIDTNRRSYAYRLRVFEETGKPAVAIVTPVEHDGATVPPYEADVTPTLLQVDDGLREGGGRLGRHAERFGEVIEGRLDDPDGGLIVFVHSPAEVSHDPHAPPRYLPIYYSETLPPDGSASRLDHLEGYRSCFQYAHDPLGAPCAEVATLIAPCTLEQSLEHTGDVGNHLKHDLDHGLDFDF